VWGHHRSYEEAKANIEKSVLEATGHAAHLDPVQMVLNNTTPSLRAPPPSSLAFYDVPDAEGQEKRIVMHSASQPLPYVNLQASTVSDANASSEEQPKGRRRRRRGRKASRKKRGSASPKKGNNTPEQQQVSAILSRVEGGNVARERWDRALNHAMEQVSRGSKRVITEEQVCMHVRPVRPVVVGAHHTWSWTLHLAAADCEGVGHARNSNS